MLLSTLGSLDGGRISRWAKREHGGLRSFVEHSMVGKLRIVEHSHKQAVVGVVPRTGDTDEIEDWDPLLENTRTSLARPRLQPAFWAAFRKPLEESVERYVVLGDRGARFVDVSIEHRPAGGVRVPHEGIVGLDASAEETHDRVEKKTIERQLQKDSNGNFKGKGGLIYVVPAKAGARHGLAPDWNAGRHTDRCVIRGHLRFGSAFEPNFHYDCKLRRGGNRQFVSCHGIETVKRGRSHVNIAPNDNIR